MQGETECSLVQARATVAEPRLTRMEENRKKLSWELASQQYKEHLRERK
jgi:hypothetical protein